MRQFTIDAFFPGGQNFRLDANSPPFTHKFSNAINNVCLPINSQSEGRDAQISDDEQELE